MSIRKNPLHFLLAAYYSTRSPSFWRKVDYDEATNTYRNSSVFRGFPAGNIGSGGFGIDTAGGFRDIRTNNNWMAPVEHAKGSFWAVSCKGKGERQSRTLRKHPSKGEEYRNIEAVQDVRFTGEIPTFIQRFTDPSLPLTVQVEGCSPLIPHDVKKSSIPATLFSVQLTNVSNEALDVSFLFSWENVLGMGGTGETGLKLTEDGHLRGYYGRLLYNEQSLNEQQPFEDNRLAGIRFSSGSFPSNSHKRSVGGNYVLASPKMQGVDLSYCSCWDAKDPAPHMIEEFKATGGISENSLADRVRKPAAAQCWTTSLRPAETFTLLVYFVWWTPDHVTEPDPVQSYRTGHHNGTREGHYYENYFQGPQEVAHYIAQHQQQLWHESIELPALIHESDFPIWLKTSLINTVDSVICNTILPQNGRLHTLEGMDWRWFFGGLTGTNDQRLSSHPYTATFFPQLDKTEVDAFRQLSRNGEVPHGNGNCDLGLNTADVPYGWPLKIAGSLDEDRWPDLILSNILQTYRLAITTGDQELLHQCWPDFCRMLDKLKSWSRNGIPEGGTTYDTFSFPGMFVYTATLYLAALKALQHIARVVDQSKIDELSTLYNRAFETIEYQLWDETHGFYWTTDQRNTVFAGAMAGDWFSRYAGLGPVLPSHKVASHLGHAYHLLVEHRNGQKGPCAFPDSEARVDGTLVKTKLMGLMKVHGYTWQFVSYLGFALLYLGMWEKGLHTLRIPYARIWHGGWPWSADLWGNAGAVYMTHPVLWALPYALTGIFLDALHGTLHVNIDQLQELPYHRVPVCFPHCWLMITKEEANSYLLEVHKRYGNPVTLERLIIEHRNGQMDEGDMLRGVQLDNGAKMRFTPIGGRLEPIH